MTEIGFAAGLFIGIVVLGTYYLGKKSGYRQGMDDALNMISKSDWF
jgi:hypothetical protein